MSTHKQVPKARLKQKTVELPQLQFINKVVEVRVTTQRRSRDVSDSIQRQSGGHQLYKREQMPQVQSQSVKQKQIPVQRVQKKIEIPQLQLVQETMRSEIRRMTLEKTFEERDTFNQAVVRIVNETARAWSIECLRYEIRGIVPPASSRQWRCKRKPNAANVRRSCRVKETSRAKSIWHDESNKIGTVLNNSHQFKIRLCEISKHISDGINKDCENQRSEEHQQIRG